MMKNLDSPDPKLAMTGEPLFLKPVAHAVQIVIIQSSVQSLSVHRSIADFAQGRKEKKKS